MVTDPNARSSECQPGLAKTMSWRTSFTVILGAIVGAALAMGLWFADAATGGLGYKDRFYYVGDQVTAIALVVVGPPVTAAALVGIPAGAIGALLLRDILQKSGRARWLLVTAMISLWACSIWGFMSWYREPRPSTIESLEFSSDGNTLVGLGKKGGRDSSFKVWDLSTKREMASGTMPDRCTDLAVSADGKVLAAVDSAGNLALWDISLGKRLASWTSPHGGMQLAMSAPILFSPNGDLLATMNKDYTVSLWDLSTRKEHVNIHAAGSWTIAFSPDGRILATGQTGGLATLWDTADGRELATLPGHSGWVCAIAFSPDGNTIATGSGSFDGDPGEVRVWDMATKKQQALFDGNKGTIRHLVFADDDKALVACLSNQQVRRWDLTTGKESGEITMDSRDEFETVYVPSQKLATACGKDGCVRLWDLVTLSEKGFLPIDPPDRRLALAANERLAATGDQQIQVWDIATGRKVAVFDGWGHFWVPSDEFHPDWKTVAALGVFWLALGALWSVLRKKLARKAPVATSAMDPAVEV